MEATYFPGQGEHATAPLREAFRLRMGRASSPPSNQLEGDDLEWFQMQLYGLGFARELLLSPLQQVDAIHPPEGQPNVQPAIAAAAKGFIQAKDDPLPLLRNLHRLEDDPFTIDRKPGLATRLTLAHWMGRQ